MENTKIKLAERGCYWSCSDRYNGLSRIDKLPQLTDQTGHSVSLVPLHSVVRFKH